MKSFGRSDIFKTIASFENLYLAYLKTKRGKGGKPKACRFSFFLETELNRLAFELNANRYRPSAYTHFMVFDPKTRQVAAPDFRDRVVQHSLVSVIEPLFEKQFIYDSYACRKNKGTHFGAKRVKKFLMAARCKHGKNRPIYVLQSDIRQFFKNISWDILLEIINKTIVCPRTFALIKMIVTSHNPPASRKSQLSLFSQVEPGVIVSERKGLPIGNLTSQLFANIYLNELDHFIKERLREKWYSRYMDDFLIIHADKDHLWRAKERIDLFLKEKLGLWLHPKKTMIKNVADGVPFVGYRIFYDHTLIRGTTLLRFQKKLAKAKRRTRKGKPDYKGEVLRKKKSFYGHLKYANAYRLRNLL